MPVVTAQNTISLGFNQTIVYGIGSSQSQVAPIPLTFASLFKSSGDLLNQCDLVYCTTITLVASTPQVLNLQALLDIIGGTVNFARVRMFAIRNNSQVDGAILKLFAAGSNDWVGLTAGAATTTINVYPGAAGSPANDGFAIWQMPNTTGATVGATNKSVKLDPGTNAFTVDLLIAGCVA